MRVEIRSESPFMIMPKKATDGSACYDLYSTIDIILVPGETKAIPLGFSMQVPSGWMFSIRSRSGMALNHNVIVLNSPGTIDSDYRGPVMAILRNFGTTNYRICQGDKIAQGLLERVHPIDFVEVDRLDRTTREGGFGSTGV